MITFMKHARRDRRLYTLTALVLGSILALAFVAKPSNAQFAGAVERAAARAAARAAEQKAAERAASRAATTAATRRAGARAGDRVVRRWSSALCKSVNPCPLPPKVSNTFKGGSYDEVVLGQDTLLYRVYSNPAHRLGRPDERFSYWSRSDARGTQAVVDSAIEVSRYGNTAKNQVVVRVPSGTRIYQGETQSIPRGGPVGGGSQVILEGIRPEWVVAP